MKRVIASAIVISSLLPVFWFSIMPNGTELCTSSIEFRTVQDGSSQRQAAQYAKSAFCRVVASYPM